jgi:hypothetical protein
MAENTTTAILTEKTEKINNLVAEFGESQRSDARDVGDDGNDEVVEVEPPPRGRATYLKELKAKFPRSVLSRPEVLQAALTQVLYDKPYMEKAQVAAWDEVARKVVNDEQFLKEDEKGENTPMYRMAGNDHLKPALRLLCNWAKQNSATADGRSGQTEEVDQILADLESLQEAWVRQALPTIQNRIRATAPTPLHHFVYPSMYATFDGPTL